MRMGLSEETGYFCKGGACGSWDRLGWIVMKIYPSQII